MQPELAEPILPDPGMVGERAADPHEMPMKPYKPMAVLQPEPSGWLRIIDKMIDRGVPVEQLAAIFDLQAKWEREQARKAYVAALSAFKANAPTLKKDKRVGFESKDKSQKVSYTHITLAEACRVLIPALGEHGLSHGWETIQQDGGIIQVTCRLSHRDGHSETVMLKSVPDNSGAKNAIQAVASTVSYLERYTFLAIVGMAAEEMDDDGQASLDKRFIDEAQVVIIKELAVKAELTEARLKKFLDVYALESFETMPVGSFEEACRKLNSVISQKGKS
jgi:hypothetical protein